jgi:hypothetical protein
MTCKRFRTEIEEAATAGALGAEAAAHVASCARCRAFGAGREALRGLVRGLPRVDAPPDFEFRLRARMAAEQPFAAGRAALFGGLLPRAAWLTAACSLALVAGFAIFTRTPNGPKLADNSPGLRAGGGGQSARRESEKAGESVAGQPAPVREQVAGGVQDGGGSQVGSVEQSAAGRVDEVNVGVSSGWRHGARAGLGGEEISESVRVAFGGRGSNVKRRARGQLRPGSEDVAARGASGGETDGASLHSFGGNEIRAIPLPVSAQEGPMEVLFKDTQGASRTVRVDPVGFGSREFAGPGARAVGVSFEKSSAKKQGVW